MTPAIKLRTLAADIENGYGLLREDREAIRAILRALADRLDEAAEPFEPITKPITSESAVSGLRRIRRELRENADWSDEDWERVAQFFESVADGIEAGEFQRAGVRAAEDRDAARALLCRSLGRDPSEPLEALVGELLDKTDALRKQNERLFTALLTAIESAQK